MSNSSNKLIGYTLDYIHNTHLGTMPVSDVDYVTSIFKSAAENYLHSTNCDHIIYAVHYNDGSELFRAHFYAGIGLSDAQYKKRVNNCSGTIYALHKNTSGE